MSKRLSYTKILRDGIPRKQTPLYKIMKKVKSYSKPISITCEICDGAGQLEKKICFHSGGCPCRRLVLTCPNCNGHGTIDFSFKPPYTTAAEYFEDLEADAAAGKEEAYERRQEVKRDLEAENRAPVGPDHGHR